jgi:hypothetical protein
MFKLLFTDQACKDIEKIKRDNGLQKRLKAVYKTLAFLEANQKHPSLNTHKYSALQGVGGEEIFEAYAENKTLAAYRIFWHYGPGKNNITIIAITSHP